MSAPRELNRTAVAICVMLGTFMQALDTTVANVALPYMQGSVSASQDEIAWVLTSYIVAAAIMTPPTGFLASRFGVKRVFLVAIGGFTIASMLCGAAQSLPQVVIFRVLQGMFGAPLVPLAQTVLFNITPPEKRGGSMAWFGVAVMVGPVLGPVLGGWLTADLSWRYVFYINLPIGVLAFLGTLIFFQNSPTDKAVKLDWFGFVTLSLAIGFLQVVLDRGEEQDWFSSSEIIWETVAGVVSIYMFLAHTVTTRRSFARPTIFRNRNLAAGTAFMLIIGITNYSSMALQPPFLQSLLNYPVVVAGLVMGPRGVGTMLAMMIVGRLTNKIDIRLLLGVGLMVEAASFFTMTQWNTDISEVSIALVGFAQGFGLGFIFVPLSTAALSTLSADERAEGAGLYNLARNIGSSVGISIVNSLLTRNAQANYVILTGYITPFNHTLLQPSLMHFWNPFTAAGQAQLSALIDRQAHIIAYMDDYKMLMLATLSALPLVLIFRKMPTAMRRGLPDTGRQKKA